VRLLINTLDREATMFGGSSFNSAFNALLFFVVIIAMIVGVGLWELLSWFISHVSATFR